VTALVAHLSSVHPAGDPRIASKQCRTLMAAGHDVVFICPHGANDVVGGIRVRGLPLRRGRLSRVTLGGWDVWRAAVRENAAVYHLHDPELLFVGVLLRLTGATVVYDVHEDVPRQILVKPWIPRPLRRVVSAVAEMVESGLARAMSGIVAATPQIARRFPGTRTVTVQNFVMPEELIVQEPTPYRTRPAVFAYVGGIATIRGVFEMIAATALVPSKLGARLLLAGPASHEGMREELARTPGWNVVVDFIGWQTRTEVARHLDGARAGLLLLHPARNYLESYPVKAFEYMAVGLPLIVSDFPLWRELFGDVGCAIFVNPLDPHDVARAMTWILEHPSEAEAMGAKGKAAVRSRFNWLGEGAKLVSFYNNLLPQSSLEMIRARYGDA
jgi:glycosyltransferase involved in cell wall biosynthesis